MLFDICGCAFSFDGFPCVAHLVCAIPIFELNFSSNVCVSSETFPSFLSGVFQGSTETTFYVLAVYFGAVGIKDTRYALGAGLIADFAGIIAAIIIGYLFYAY